MYIGHVGWVDLTVDNASEVKHFYEEVVGWKSSETPMGDYADYTMSGPDGEPVSGVCHRRGPNADLPPKWLIYITVANLDASLAKVQHLGGKIVAPVRRLGTLGRFAVIEDPAGAVAALFEPAQLTS